MKNYEIKVSGKVQKVGYRQSTKAEAEKLGVKGWVKNLEDGSVLIEAEGQEQVIKQLIEWCRKGPLFSNVKDVTFTDGEVKSYVSFDIK